LYERHDSKKLGKYWVDEISQVRNAKAVRVQKIGFNRMWTNAVFLDRGEIMNLNKLSRLNTLAQLSYWSKVGRCRLRVLSRARILSVI
jgi:hypothetical protein